MSIQASLNQMLQYAQMGAYGYQQSDVYKTRQKEKIVKKFEGSLDKKDYIDDLMARQYIMPEDVDPKTGKDKDGQRPLQEHERLALRQFYTDQGREKYQLAMMKGDVIGAYQTLAEANQGLSEITDLHREYKQRQETARADKKEASMAKAKLDKENARVKEAQFSLLGKTSQAIAQKQAMTERMETLQNKKKMAGNELLSPAIQQIINKEADK